MPQDNKNGEHSVPLEPNSRPSTLASTVVENDIDEILTTPVRWEDLFGKTVLVSGASGMIPSYVVYTLLRLNDVRDAGIRVLGLVRNLQKAQHILADIVERGDFTLIEGDVMEPLTLSEDVDLVVHGASPARPSLHSATPVTTIRANLQGTFNLLDLCVASGNAPFVLMSSAEVYGQQPAGTSLLSEDSYGAVDILNPRACYTEGKRAAETIAVSYHAQHGMPITIARFGHIFGPGMALDDGRVQADFTADVVAGRNITLNSDGSARRTYTYLADAISGMFCALLSGDNTAYNISDHDGFISIRDLAIAFTKARPGKSLEVQFGSDVDVSKYNPVLGQGLDDTKLRALGWKPQVGLKAGLDRTVAWHEERLGSQ